MPQMLPQFSLAPLDPRGRIAIMITRFEVEGFKSLRSFAVDLEPLTAFVGPNGAGKSNLLEAMALLGRLASLPVEQAFKMGRGRILDQFSRSGGETGRSIRFAVDVSLGTAIADHAGNPLPTRYRYELVIERQTRDSGLEELVVADESLRVRLDSATEAQGTAVLVQERINRRNRRVDVLDYFGTGNTLALTPSSHTSLAAAADGLLQIQVKLPHEDVALIKTIKRDRGYRTLKETLGNLVAEGIKATAEEVGIDLDAPHSPVGWSSVRDAVTNEITQFRLIHLDAARLREPTEKISSGILAPDASNLAAVLADLPAPILGTIRADLVSLIPGLAGFDIVSDGDSLRIDFKLSGGDVLPARLASDGTLRALALLAVLTVEPHPSVIAIEEPENGIYPGRLRRLIMLLRDLAVHDGETQVLLTTHSPVVVAALRDKPELLRVVDIIVRDGKRDTRARSVGKPKQPGDSAFVASLREVDNLLHSADAEAAE